jgi:hypothetical protein
LAETAGSAKDGVPDADTASAIYDNLDFIYAFRAFTDTFQGVSVEAIRQGLESVGVKDNELVHGDLVPAYPSVVFALGCTASANSGNDFHAGSTGSWPGRGV